MSHTPHCFDRGDAEKTRVEVCKVFLEKITSQNTEATWAIIVLVIMSIDIETIGRYFGGVAGFLVQQHIPEPGRRVNVSREPAA